MLQYLLTFILLTVSCHSQSSAPAPTVLCNQVLNSKSCWMESNCRWSNGECVSNTLSAYMSSSSCEYTACPYYFNEDRCHTDSYCYWDATNNQCNVYDELPAPFCEYYLGEDSCYSDHCYWRDGKCHNYNVDCTSGAAYTEEEGVSAQTGHHLSTVGLCGIIVCSMLFGGLVTAMCLVFYKSKRKVATFGVEVQSEEAICDDVPMEDDECNMTVNGTETINGMKDDETEQIMVDIQIGKTEQ